mmetsp:Transcript_21698/g.35601  ORF Transcript_21698/g.35601 Transcript_21698/m.35601 type:complete len:201 (+) Transcript_21698:3-605(+)
MSKMSYVRYTYRNKIETSIVRAYILDSSNSACSCLRSSSSSMSSSRKISFGSAPVLMPRSSASKLLLSRIWDVSLVVGDMLPEWSALRSSKSLSISVRSLSLALLSGDVNIRFLPFFSVLNAFLFSSPDALLAVAASEPRVAPFTQSSSGGISALSNLYSSCSLLVGSSSILSDQWRVGNDVAALVLLLSCSPSFASFSS